MKIVVTGATKGIGAAIATKFAAEGFDLAICARSLPLLEQLKKEWQEKYKVDILALPIDMSRKAEVLHFAAKIAEWGCPDILINNAGVFLPGNIADEADGTFEQLWQTNVASAYHLTRALLPQMKAAGSGHIFNICSTASIKAYPQGGSYCISKFALLGFSKGLREELQDHNIKVTALLPGATFTASWEGTTLREDRFMSAEDVADMVWSISRLSSRSVVEEVILRPMLGDL